MKKYILGAVLSLGILVSPAFVQASGLTDAQVQSILSLLSVFGADSATIASVNTALTGVAPTTGSTAFCHDFNSDLTVGSGGDEVSALNRALSMAGIDTTDNSSKFSENNAGDVVSFQAKYGIRQTGYVGPLTRARLNKLYGCLDNQQPTPQPMPYPQPTQPEQPVTPCAPCDPSCAGNSGAPTGVGCVQPSTVVSERVKCVFNGATTEQKCWGDVPTPTANTPVERYSCAGTGTCVVTIKGKPGALTTWGSSCGGSVNITIENDGDYANFKCAVVTTIPETAQSITIINPNGGGYWYRGNYAVVGWKTAGVPQDSQMLIRLRSVDTGQEYNLTTVNNSGRAEIAIPTTIPVGAYNLEIKTAVNGQSYLDASDSYFKVIDTNTVTPVTTSVVLPTINSVVQNSDNLFAITITGTNFSAENEVMIDGVRRSYLSSDNGGTILGVSTIDVGGPGTKQFQVVTSGGSSNIVSASILPVDTTAPALKVSLTAYPTMITAGQSSTLYLSSQNAVKGCSISNVDGMSGASSATIHVSPTQTTTYTATCAGVNGSTSQSITVTVTTISLGTGISQVAGVAGAVDVLTSNNQPQVSFKYVWNRDLQIGSPYFNDVIVLQTVLTQEGVYSGEITGGFYSQTFNAVQAFQQKYGINATGFVGPDTRAKLNTLY